MFRNQDAVHTRMASVTQQSRSQKPQNCHKASGFSRRRVRYHSSTVVQDGGQAIVEAKIYSRLVATMQKFERARQPRNANIPDSPVYI